MSSPGASDRGPHLGALRPDVAYIPLDTGHIPLSGDVPFDLYLRSAERYVLYHRSGTAPLRWQDVQALRERGVAHLYIDARARHEAARFVEARLARRLRDSTLTVPERASSLVEVSRFIMDDLLSRPEAPECLHRVRRLVEQTVDFIASGRAAFRGIIGLFNHDYYTYTHTLHVGVYAVALGQQLGLSAEFQRKLGEGALYHDVGKALVPHELLTRPGPLSSDEWDVMKQHPQLGADLIAAHGPCDSVTRAAILAHHERIDGSGYPFGLRGDEVGLPGRIVALADIYDALTTNRSYHRALRSYAALDLMKDQMIGGIDSDLFRELVVLLARTDGAW